MMLLYKNNLFRFLHTLAKFPRIISLLKVVSATDIVSSLTGSLGVPTREKAGGIHFLCIHWSSDR